MTAEAQAADSRILIFSFYRDAELQGARLLLNLHRHLSDPDSQIKLSRHLADETRHAWLWTRRIVELNGSPVQVADGYQRRLGLRAGLPRDPVDLLALTIVAEQRALDRYQAHLTMPGLDADTREVLEAVSGDESWHLSWVEHKMRELAARDGAEVRAERTLERYRQIEREVYATFAADEAVFLQPG